MIMLIVLAVSVVCLVVLAALVVWLGWPVGLLVAILITGAVVASYVWIIKPWHLRWGATDDETARTMPGDELIPDAAAATRAITIKANAAEVWPWLVQIGYGKAGWYSYDWIDNDFQPSADRILPEHQHLSMGDKILMMPTMGFIVQSVDVPTSIVSLLGGWFHELVPRPLCRRRRCDEASESVAAKV